MEREAPCHRLRSRPGLLLRWFFRAPVALYRIGLGSVMFGQMELTTVGRRSGLPRRTVVDVLGHDASSAKYYALSAYGESSHWYRNILATPTVRVQVRRRKFEGRAEVLGSKQAERLFLDYWRRHRFYVSTMLRLIGAKAANEAEARKAVGQMRVVAIQPVEGGDQRRQKPN